MDAVSFSTNPRRVRWGQGPLCFEIASDHDDILRRAATIMAPWPAPSGARLARRFQLSPADPAQGRPCWQAFTAFSDDGVGDLFGRGEPASLMQAIEFDGVRELLNRPDEILGLHAALVSRATPAGERGVALVGPCFSGKSTLSCTLWHRGWSFLGDDATLFDEDGRAYPAPRRASMRRGSKALIGDVLWASAAATPASDLTDQGLLFHPHEVRGASRPERVRLAAIVFLARLNADVAPAELRQLSQVDGAVALVPHANLRKTAFPEALSRIAPLAERVPIHDLGRGPLDAMVARLNALMDGFTES